MIPVANCKFLICLLLLLLPLAIVAESDGGDECSASEEDSCRDKNKALKLRIGSIFLILAAGAIGVLVPIVGRAFPFLSPDGGPFFVMKAFAAGVILATGFIHVLPDAFDSLGSPCLSKNPWSKFPFAGFIAMMTALGTLIMETTASSYFKRIELRRPADEHDAEGRPDQAADGEIHGHTHATHSHAHGPHAPPHGAVGTETMRHRIVSQVLELGIVVHSVIIGLALGASDKPCTIKPLMAALSFHQFFEGMGLGGCIVQAQYKFRAIFVMILFFALTTPVGIALGIGMSSSYDEASTKTLVVEGCLNAASSGILIYMALVDLLATDFNSPRIQESPKLQTLTNLFLLLGAGLMSVIAKWN